MCGLFGIVRNEKLSDKDKLGFDKLFELLSHRGPDSDGQVILDNLAIGMKRLAIVDKKLSTQPIWNSEKTVCVFANCEIYNFEELRSFFVQSGEEIVTKGDVEIILHAYLNFGEEFTRHIFGMFAVVVLDFRENKIVLARDRLGEKPLYLERNPNGLIFSSELMPLIESGLISANIEREAVQAYLEYGYINEEQSLISNIQKIKPGTIEVYNLQGKHLHSNEFWSMSEIEFSNVKENNEELIKLFESVVKQSTMSDNEVTLALSSGLDSSILALLMRKESLCDFSALTVSFPGQSAVDESDLAHTFAEELGIKWIKVNLESKTVANNFTDLIEALDEPISDIASAGYLAIFQQTRLNGSKVLLTGQGVDELFWGYEWTKRAANFAERRKKSLHEKFSIADYLKFLPMPIGIGPKCDWLLDWCGLRSNFKQSFVDLYDRKSGNLEFCLNDYAPRYKARKRIINRVIDKGNRTTTKRTIQLSSEVSVSREIINEISSTYLRINGLQQIDRLGMSQSIESRTPFVDHRIVELAIKFSESVNHFYNPEKYFVRKIFSDLPSKILVKPKKGFKPPIKDWYWEIYRYFKNDLKELRIIELGLVNKKAKRYLKKPVSTLGRARILWLELLILELWIRNVESKISPMGFKVSVSDK